MAQHLFDRIRAALLHGAISGFVLLGAAALVLLLWYPHPLAELSGGTRLMGLLMCVDFALGPLLTLLIFDRRKRRAELKRDVVVVICLQVAALGYGLYVAFQARPLYIVFEYDQFRIIHARDLNSSSQLEGLPWQGPKLLALKTVPADHRERMLFAELSGTPLAAQPSLWQPYELAAIDVKARAKPLHDVAKSYPAVWGAIGGSDQEVAGISPSDIGCLPVIGKNLQYGMALVSLLDGRLLRIVLVDYQAG